MQLYAKIAFFEENAKKTKKKIAQKYEVFGVVCTFLIEKPDEINN